MTEKTENRSRVWPIRLKPCEYDELEKRYQKTGLHSLSAYARNVLLEKPITVFYRDKSMDEILEELVLLRRELNAVGNNLNQAMYLINAQHGQADAKLWLQLLNAINSKLEPNIAQIKDRMNQYAELWSQKLKVEKV